MSRIAVKVSSLRETNVRDYAIRFLFGGLCTIMAGLVAKHFGPGIGGLFLAFPAIFPASASLIESRERRKKAKHGIDGTMRGRAAASVDAAGSAIGSIGLIGFAFTVWKAIAGYNPCLVVTAATVCWAVISVAAWYARKSRVLRHLRQRL